jgi:hypothetical protein
MIYPIELIMNKKVLFATGRMVFILSVLLVGQSTIKRRAQATSYTVKNTFASGYESLRWAIEQTNNNTGPGIISSNIPKSDPGYNIVSDAWLIQPASPLPSLTGGGTTVDGFTQTTSQGDTNLFGPEVLIDGIALSSTSWIFSVDANDNVIKGLTIFLQGASPENQSLFNIDHR